jgi:hypothetical protein
MQMLMGGSGVTEHTLNKNEDDEEENDGAPKIEPSEFFTLNLHVRELRQPKHSQDRLSPGKPCENFNRYYLPNGKQVALKSP